MFGKSGSLALLQKDVVPVPPEVMIWYAFKCLPFSTQLCLSADFRPVAFFFIHLLPYSSKSYTCP